MLDACNTCARLQSRVTSSGATVDGLFFLGFFVCFFLCLFILFCLFVRFCYFVCSCFCQFVLLRLFFVIIVVVVVFFSFLGDWGMGVEALFRKNTGVLMGSYAS